MVSAQDVKDVYEFLKKAGDIEMQNKFLSAKEELLDLREKNLDLRQQVNTLQEQLFLKDEVKFDGTLYWIMHEDKEKEGPFCPRCYDADKKLIRIHYENIRAYWDCRACHAKYGVYSSPL